MDIKCITTVWDTGRAISRQDIYKSALDSGVEENTVNLYPEVLYQEYSGDTKSPSQLIDERIEELGDWWGQILSKVRNLIRQVNPEVVEEWKWRVAAVNGMS